MAAEKRENLYNVEGTGQPTCEAERRRGSLRPHTSHRLMGAQIPLCVCSCWNISIVGPKNGSLDIVIDVLEGVQRDQSSFRAEYIKRNKHNNNSVQAKYAGWLSGVRLCLV